MTDKTLETLSACIRLSRKLLETAATAETLSATEIVACGGLAKPWRAGVFALGDIRQHEGVVYKCCQGHDSTSNPAWEPGTVPALWTAYHTTDPARALPYTAPTGAQDAYYIGECVVFGGAVYRCLADATTHDPEVLATAWEQIESEG